MIYVWAGLWRRRRRRHLVSCWQMWVKEEPRVLSETSAKEDSCCLPSYTWQQLLLAKFGLRVLSETVSRYRLHVTERKYSCQFHTSNANRFGGDSFELPDIEVESLDAIWKRESEIICIYKIHQISIDSHTEIPIYCYSYRVTACRHVILITRQSKGRLPTIRPNLYAEKASRQYVWVGEPSLSCILNEHSWIFFFLRLIMIYFKQQATLNCLGLI